MRLGHLSVGTLSNKLIDMNAVHACYSNLRTFSGLIGGARTPTHKYIAMAAPSHYASHSLLGTFTNSLSSAGLLTHLRPLHRTLRHRPRPTLRHPLSSMAFEPHAVFFGIRVRRRLQHSALPGRKQASAPAKMHAGGAALGSAYCSIQSVILQKI